MSVAEAPATEPTKKANRARRKRKVAKAPKPKPVAEFAGLTVHDCCSGCNASGCIISGKSYCGHPFKGGLQGRDMQNDPAIARLNAAKKMLGKAKIKLDAI